jgi:crotonobetainyl-CoA:carnitine CoA-transferase CaiB-like acyl-CoA transferase
MTLPLADVRILAMEQFGAGPWATLQLSDLGAEVIKIEDPASRGDIGRFVPPYQEGEDSVFFETFNRNKRSLSLDFRQPDARAVFHDLVRVSDAVYSNLRGDQPPKLGLKYADLRDVNPRIVCCSLSGFGMTGPRASEGGYDYMIQGLAGWQSLTGEPDGPPAKSGMSLVDLSAGYASTIALLAALWRARRDGVGCDCDVSLFETALHELMYLGPWVATHDPRFATTAARNENREALLPVLEALFLERTVSEWIDRLVPAGVPSAKINTVAEALEDPQAVARGAIVEHDHPALGTVRTIASPLRLEDAEGRDLRVQPPSRAPFRGEHTEQVLVEVCGYTPERVRELQAAGVFGDVAVGAQA